jgi:predicted RNA-binding protein
MYNAQIIEHVLKLGLRKNSILGDIYMRNFLFLFMLSCISSAVSDEQKPAYYLINNAISQKELVNFIKYLPIKCQKTIDFEQTATCAKKYFVIDGEPINPLIVKDLIPWISDSGDQVVAIDLLTSQKSNKYSVNNFDLKKNGAYFSISTTYESGSSFTYELEGVTANGVIVLKTSDWDPTGTGVFTDLLLVRIRKEFALSNNLDEKLTLNRNRLIIENIGRYSLGDRIYSKITVIGNTINIETKQSEDSPTKKMLIKLSL